MAYSTHGYTYGIYNLDEGLLKVGQTTRPDVRLRDLGVGRHDQFKTLFCLWLPAHHSRSLEGLIHECIWNAKEAAPHLPAPTEWFRVPLEHAQFIARVATDFAALLETIPENDRGNFITGARDAARRTRTSVIGRS